IISHPSPPASLTPPLLVLIFFSRFTVGLFLPVILTLVVFRSWVGPYSLSVLSVLGAFHRRNPPPVAVRSVHPSACRRPSLFAASLRPANARRRALPPIALPLVVKLLPHLRHLGTMVCASSPCARQWRARARPPPRAPAAKQASTRWPPARLPHLRCLFSSPDGAGQPLVLGNSDGEREPILPLAPRRRVSPASSRAACRADPATSNPGSCSRDGDLGPVMTSLT
ncbi:unnamed protein product, partial [Urochloa humidicola]